MYTDETNDLVVGAWRNGLEASVREYVQEAESRASKGFRQLYMEYAVIKLCQLLDGYDSVASELLNESSK